jgi:hypothetical protein
MTRLLVVGMPRSGTTWAARILAAAVGTEAVDEPDNHFVSPYAYRAKRQLGQGSYPRLRPGDTAPAYERLWQAAFALGDGRAAGRRDVRARRRLARELLHRQSADHVARTLTHSERARPALRAAELLATPAPSPPPGAVVVKSVYAALSLEWVEALCSPLVVVVLRHPLNVVSSWLEMDWLGDDLLATLAPRFREELAARYDAPRPTHAWSPLEQAAWIAGALTSVLADLESTQTRAVVSHERLCEDPETGFRRITDSLGVGWSPAAAGLLHDLDRPGRGYETARVAAQLGDVWRSRLSREQVAQARAVLRAFPAAASAKPR